LNLQVADELKYALRCYQHTSTLYMLLGILSEVKYRIDSHTSRAPALLRWVISRRHKKKT